MCQQNCGERPYHVLNALVGRQQAEREQNGFTFRAKAVFEVVGVHEVHIGDAVWNDINLAVWNRVNVAQEFGREFAHHHQAIGKTRDFFEHSSLIYVRFTKNRMQCCNQRHFQFTKQG